MPLHLVPIPPDHLDGSKAHWSPYILAIAERANNDPAEMARMLYAGEATAFLVWDAVSAKSQAFIGVEYRISTKGRIGQIIWLMGENRAEWVHLFDDLEAYLRETERCVMLKAISRRGWSKFLKSNGYRETHVVMEKELVDVRAP